MNMYSVKISDINEKIVNQLYLQIDKEKMNKIKKYLNKYDRSRSLIGEILVRTIIIDKLKICNEYIKFDLNRYGKPYLRKKPCFHFNISHSGDYVVCAVDDKPIGIDVEEIKDIEYEELAKKIFTIQEYNYIINKGLDNQLDRFYEIWTLKESYIKCCGKGLTIPLQSFTIIIDQLENIKIINNDEYMKYTFKIFNIGLNYKVSLCTLNHQVTTEIIDIEQDCLIDRWIN